MRTLNVNWVDDFRKEGCEPVFLVDIGLDSSTHYFSSKLSSVLSARHATISAIRQTPASMDVETRKISVSQWEVEFADGGGYLRGVIAANNVKGKSMDIALGRDGSSEGDYIQVSPKLVIDEYSPGDGNAISVVGVDKIGFFIDKERHGYWNPDTPHGVIRQMLTEMVPAADVSDPSLDERNLDNAVSRLVFSRWPYNLTGFGISGDIEDDLIKVSSQLQDLLQSIHASLIDNPDNEFKILVWDRNKAVDRNLGSVADFSQDSTVEHIFNEVSVSGRKRDGEDLVLYKALDSSSITDFQYPGSGHDNPFATELDSTWFNAWINYYPFDQYIGSATGTLYPFDNTATQFWVGSYPLYRGFSGTLLKDASNADVNPPSTTQQSEHQISATYPAYFLFTDHAGNQEVVKAEAFAYETTGTSPYSNITSPLGTRPFFRRGRYTSVTRALFGTTATDWDSIARSGTFVTIYDISAAVYLGNTFINHFARGIPVVSFTVPTVNADLEHGDAITISEPRFLMKGVNGADDTCVFEILRVGNNGLNSTGGIRIVAAFLRKTGIDLPSVESWDQGDVPVAGEKQSNEGGSLVNRPELRYPGQGLKLNDVSVEIDSSLVPFKLLRIPIPEDSTGSIQATLHARESGSTEHGTIVIRATFSRATSGNVVVDTADASQVVWSSQTTGASELLANWSDDSDGNLYLLVSHAVSGNCMWSVTDVLMEVW